MDTQLAENEYVVENLYSIADMAIWPWTLNWKGQEQSLADTPSFARWIDAVGQRPAAQASHAVGREQRDRVRTAEEKAEANRIGFARSSKAQLSLTSEV